MKWGTPLMEEAVDLFTDAYMYDDWSKRTLKFHLENLAVFKKFLLTRQKGARVSSRLLEDFIGEMRKNGRMLNTINGRIKTLREYDKNAQIKGVQCSPTLSGIPSPRCF